MSTPDTVARLYDRLTGDERMRLVVAAGARGDEAEIERLIRAARKRNYAVPDSFAPMTALLTVTWFHHMEQLHHAALFYFLLGIAEADSDGKEVGRRGDDGLRFAAYVYRTGADGWRLFCERLGVDAAYLTAGLPGGEFVLAQAAKAAETLAFDEGVAADYFRRNGDGLIRTAESVAAALAAAHAEARREWGLPPTGE